MKKNARRKLDRDLFVLTAEEQRIVCFVLAALLLGSAVKHYRATRPSPAVTNAITQSARAVSHPVEKSPGEKRRRR